MSNKKKNYPTSVSLDPTFIKEARKLVKTGGEAGLKELELSRDNAIFTFNEHNIKNKFFSFFEDNPIYFFLLLFLTLVLGIYLQDKYDLLVKIKEYKIIEKILDLI